MNRARMTTMILVAALAAPAVAIGDVAAAPPKSADVVIGEYRAILESSDSDVFRLYKSGVLVRQIDDFARLGLGETLEQGSEPLVPGSDVNADGIPDLVVFGWSGGAHCCFVAWVFSLGDEFAILAEIVGEHTEVRVTQADDDPALEFAVRDWTCAYWPSGFAGSPSVEVVLDWRGTELAPSAVLTEAVLPPTPDLAALARRYAEDPSWNDKAYDPVSGIFATALALAYRGDLSTAATFIADAWGGDRASMTRMTVEFGWRLGRSRYLGAILQERMAAGQVLR